MSSIKIKKIELRNFKSYGNQTIDNLHENMNVIIGKNGHGKSNVHHGEYFLLVFLPKILDFWLENWNFADLSCPIVRVFYSRLTSFFRIKKLILVHVSGQLTVSGERMVNFEILALI